MELTQVWQEYQKGLDYLNSINLFDRVEKCHQMVSGDQWHGLKSGDERPAQLNILLPIMKNSTALVGQNTMTINYSSMNYDTDRKLMLEVCDKLNKHASRTWEKLKLDKYNWEVLQDAFTAGDKFYYFYDDGDEKSGEIKMQLIDTTNVMLADEQNSDIQEQPYILIVQRRYIEDVKKEAKKNKIPQDDIGNIIPDDDTTGQINGDNEVKGDNKLISIMKLWKLDGVIHVCRSTKTVVYQPDTVIDGLTRYPIAQYTWNPLKGTARGMGDIWDKIPNQISINKNLYRFESAIKSSAFPHKVYDRTAFADTDIKALSIPDSNIAVDDLQHVGVDKLIHYLQPANISPYAKDIWKDMIQQTRELSGAGDNLENINPEQASGAAINAAREAKQLNVNAQVASYKQFIEDIAMIWFDMWVAYNPNGLQIVIEDDGNETAETISPEQLQELKVDVRIDVSPNNPYSKMAQELGLKDLFTSQFITFDEYVEALDDDGVMPKAKLQDILEKRKQVQNMQAADMITKQTQIIQQLQMENQQLKPAAQKLVELSQSGGNNVLR